MDEVVLRRVVGVLTLAVAAFLLSWLLPRPGLDRLRGEGERVVTVDLTRPDAAPQELPPPSDEDAPPSGPAPPAAAPAQQVADAATGPSPSPSPSPSTGAPPPTTDAVAPPAPAPPNRPVETPPAEPKPPATRPTASKPPEPKPAETPPVAPKAVEPRLAEPRPTPPAAASAAGAGPAMVQAGAYSHLDKAEAVRTRAAGAGQRCVISPAETAKGTLYRLRCGPYADRAQAQSAIASLAAAGIPAQIVGGGR